MGYPDYLSLLFESRYHFKIRFEETVILHAVSITVAFYDSRAHSVQIFRFIAVFFQKFNKIPGIYNLTVRKNDIRKQFDLFCTCEAFLGQGLSFIFYGFINCLTLLLTVNMNQSLVNCDKIFSA